MRIFKVKLYGVKASKKAISALKGAKGNIDTCFPERVVTANAIQVVKKGNRAQLNHFSGRIQPQPHGRGEGRGEERRSLRDISLSDLLLIFLIFFFSFSSSLF